MLSIVMENPQGMKVLLGLQIVSYYLETQMDFEAPLLLLFSTGVTNCLSHRLLAYSIFQPWHLFYSEG